MPQLFIAGAARTGTTALCSYLNMHPQICVLNERYKGSADGIMPDHFRFSRIMENVETESNQPREQFEALLSSKREGDLKWVGDKAYGYTLSMERVKENNPGCVLLMTLRDPVAVAASYLDRKRNPLPNSTWLANEDAAGLAIRHCNASATRARRFVNQRFDTPLIIIEYESFFKHSESYEPLLSKVLELDMTSVLEDWHKENEKFATGRESKPISKKEQSRVSADIKWQAFEWVKDYSLKQREEALAR